MEFFVRIPLVFLFGVFSLIALVFSFYTWEEDGGRFQLGDPIIRYSEKMDKQGELKVGFKRPRLSHHSL